MSADNTIAVLKTPAPGGKPGEDFEFRVIHAQAIENIYHTDLEWHPEDFNISGNPKEIVKYFGDCEVFLNHHDVWKQAQKMMKDLSYVEYGINQFEFEKPFWQFKREAKNLPKYSWEKKRKETLFDNFKKKSQKTKSKI